MYNAFQLKRILNRCTLSIYNPTTIFDILYRCGYGQDKVWFNRCGRFWSFYLETEQGILMIRYRYQSVEVTATH